MGLGEREGIQCLYHCYCNPQYSASLCCGWCWAMAMELVTGIVMVMVMGMVLSELAGGGEQ